MRNHIDTDFFTLPRPRAIGHRGSAGTHPENTMESFRAAAATTAPYIEFDVHMTRDGEIVVAHDDHLARMCGLENDRTIPEMTHAEVAAADAARMFSIDGATFPYRDQGMLQLIDRAAMRRNVLIASEHQEPLDEIRKLAPEIPTNFSYLETGLFFQAMASRDPTYQPPGAALQIPRQYESWQLVTNDSVEFAHSLGIEVHVWTVNEESEMTELLDMGVDGIISDYPNRLLALIRKRPPIAPY